MKHYILPTPMPQNEPEMEGPNGDMPHNEECPLLPAFLACLYLKHGEGSK